MNIDTSRRTDEQNSRTEQPRGVDPEVRRGFDQVEDEIEAVREDNQELRGELEKAVTENAELREMLEQRDEDLERLREEKEDLQETIESLSDRLNGLEGDMKCPSCDAPIHAAHVDEVRQEETGGEGFLETSSFDGPVTEVQCPGCGESIDMTERSDRERDEFTDRLREFGIAAGEPVNRPPEKEDSSVDESESSEN